MLPLLDDLIVEVDAHCASTNPMWTGIAQETWWTYHPPPPCLPPPMEVSMAPPFGPCVDLALLDLAYIQAASTMADSIAAVTGDSQAKWSRFFMAVKQDPTTRGLSNTTATISPIPDQAFIPVVASPTLQYYLTGKKDVPQDSPLFPYWCYKCN
ncbi:hypothetical protein J3A83DRAFT_4187088 [Scleroderma citrinum]